MTVPDLDPNGEVPARVGHWPGIKGEMGILNCSRGGCGCRQFRVLFDIRREGLLVGDVVSTQGMIPVAVQCVACNRTMRLS